MMEMPTPEGQTRSIGSASSLMQPVEWQGKVYFTSHYFHQWYLVNSASSEGKAKFQRHDSFIRRIKSIESYHLYLERCNIVELTFSLATKSVEFNKNNNLRDIFRRLNHRPIYLIDETFQMELSHHLDDDVSKGMAYLHSKSTAEQEQIGARHEKAKLLGATRALLIEKAEMYKLFGYQERRALVNAALHVQREYGEDLSPYMEKSPALLSAEQEPTWLGIQEVNDRFKLKPGLLNNHLASVGMQEKDEISKKRPWKPTAKALQAGYCREQPVIPTHGKCVVEQVFWREDFIVPIAQSLVSKN
jgi:hypothetical protein